MLVIKHVSKSFHSNQHTISILNELELTIEQGSWISIIGPSGSGKSTFLKCLSGLIQTDSGEIIINEMNITNLSDKEKSNFRRLNMGFVFQDFKLLPYYSVLDNVVLPLINDLPKKELYPKAKELLISIGISVHLWNRLPDSLSGGEQQRVAIARALIGNPSVLLCDEPTGNLDISNRDNIIQVLQSLKEKGHTIIVVTHDMELAAHSDSIYALQFGKLIEQAVMQS